MTTPTTVPVRLQLRADTAANWTSVNPILLANELGRETDTGKIKIGNGTSTWTSLAYQAWATLPVAVNAGGTGQTSYTNGQLLIGNTTGNTLTKATLTAGSGVAITNGTGSITVAASGIADANIASDAEIAVSKLQDGTARQLLQTAANGTDVEWASNIDIPGTLDVTGNAVFDANLTVQGDLTVNGTETIINTQTLTIEDKNIELGKVTSPTDVTADGGGITLKGTTDKTINWIDATDAWTLSEHVDLATGKEYRINGAQVLTGTALGSGVTSSSLTSVGTISSGTWQGTTVGTAYGGTGQTTYANGELLIGKTDGTLAKATLTAGTGVAVTNADGSVTVAVDSTVVTTAQTGTVTSTMIADGTIVDADVNASAAIAGTKISPDFGSQNVVTTGTSTAASLIPTGSSVPTNGVYLPAANSVGISTDGTGRLFVDASGNVGVGTASPSYRFHSASGAVGITSFANGIDGASEVGLLLRGASGSHNTSLLFSSSNTNFRTRQYFNVLDGSLKWDTSSDGAVFSERMRLDSTGRFDVNGAGTAGVSPAFSINGSAPSNSAVVDSNGRLGLGTSSPQTSLHVAKDSNAVSTQPFGDFQNNGQAFITGATNLNKRLALGVDTTLTNMVGVIQAIEAGVTARPLSLNPSGGSVGIGTTSPGDILSATGGNIALQSAGGAGAGDRPTERRLLRSDIGSVNGLAAIGMNGAGTSGFLGEIKFYTGSADLFNTSLSERARIDSSGRLLVGTSTARSVFGVVLPVQNETTGAAGYAAIRNSNDVSGSYLSFSKSRGISNGSSTIVQNDDQIGAIFWTGANGTNIETPAAQIECRVDGTPGQTAGTFVVGTQYRILTTGTTDFTLIGAADSNPGTIFTATGAGTGTGTAIRTAGDMPGRLVFSTTADGASSPTERLRITNAGVLQIANAGNISVGTTTGTKIGTATTQKLGFYNATPVVQPTAVADATDAATAISQLNALLAHMRTLGLIAT
jgi:hypothetical protein